MTEAKKYKLDPARVSEATKLASEIARSFKGAAEKSLYRAMPRVGKPESRENLSIDGERKSIGLVGSESRSAVFSVTILSLQIVGWLRDSGAFV